MLHSTSMLACALVLGASSVRAQACNNYTLVYTGATINGTDGHRFRFADPSPNPHLLARTYVPSVNDCAAVCESNTACMGFAIFHRGHQLECNTVDDTTPTLTSLRAESYRFLRAPAPTAGQLRVWPALAAEAVFQEDSATGVRFCARAAAAKTAAAATAVTAAAGGGITVLDLAGVPGQRVAGQVVLRVAGGPSE